MASCVGCKKRTTSFCFVHKVSVCDDCTAIKGAGLAAPAAVVCQPNDVIGNYFDWLADGDFAWPPHCTLCNRTLGAEPGTVSRLVCKHTFHEQCLREHMAKALHVQHVDPKSLKCATCNALMVDPATQPRTKLREAVQAMVQQAVQAGAAGGAASAPATSPIQAAVAATPPAATAAAASSSSTVSAAAARTSARYSPAVRDLMSQAASARAAMPAGTAHTAISLVRVPESDSSSSSSNNSGVTGAGTSAGLYPVDGPVSRVSAAPSPHSAAAASSTLASPTSASPSSSHSHSDSLPFPSLSLHSHATGLYRPSPDLERQADDADESQAKGHKPMRSRLAALRALTQPGGWLRRPCTPQRVIVTLLLIAVITLIAMYVYQTSGAGSMEGARTQETLLPDAEVPGVFDRSRRDPVPDTQLPFNR